MSDALRLWRAGARALNSPRVRSSRVDDMAAVLGTIDVWCEISKMLSGSFRDLRSLASLALTEKGLSGAEWAMEEEEATEDAAAQ